MGVYGEPIDCFWIEPTPKIQRKLRRYTSRQGNPSGWECADGWHEAWALIEPLEDVPPRASYDESDERETSGDLWPHDDPRWPTHCKKGCGYAFTDEDTWQLFTERIYRRPDGQGEDYTLVLHDETRCPPGAMWNAWWLPDGWKGEDGISLNVMLPDGVYWTVDGPSSSCTEQNAKPARSHDTRTGHRCWSRTGDPKANPPTVDVNPSILSGHPETYHGFLRHGKLVSV